MRFEQRLRIHFPRYPVGMQEDPQPDKYTFEHGQHGTRAFQNGVEMDSSVNKALDNDANGLARQAEKVYHDYLMCNPCGLPGVEVLVLVLRNRNPMQVVLSYLSPGILNCPAARQVVDSLCKVLLVQVVCNNTLARLQGHQQTIVDDARAVAASVEADATNTQRSASEQAEPSSAINTENISDLERTQQAHLATTMSPGTAPVPTAPSAAAPAAGPAVNDPTIPGVDAVKGRALEYSKRRSTIRELYRTIAKSPMGTKLCPVVR